MMEEELEGYIVLVNDDYESSSPASVRFQPQSFSSSIVLLYREHSWTHFYKHRLKLKGYFMHSTLRGKKLFEVTDVTVLSLYDSSSFKFPSPIQGRVSSISQCLKLKNGPAVFVTFSKMRDYEDTDCQRIVLLSKSAIQCASFIYEGCILTLNNPQRFKWKTEPEEADKIPEYCSASNVVYYSIDDANCLSVSKESSFGQSVAAAPQRKGAAAISAEELVAPLSLLDKEALAGTEFPVLTGRVQSVHTTGWLELRDVELSLRGTRWSCAGSSASESNHQQQPSDSGDRTGNDTENTTISLPTCVVYLSHHCLQHLRLTALGVSVRQGAVLAVNRVVPVYLWGSMKGFATSCRSKINITEFAQSKKFVSREPNYCAVTVKIPGEVRASCTVYAAWRVEVQRKLAQALGPQLLKLLCSEEQLIASVEALSTYTDAVSGGGALGIREVMQLAPSALQDELFDLHRVLLYTIRNGHDADWLGNHLPQLHTVSHFVSKLRYLQEQLGRGGSAADPVLAIHWHDPCTVPTSSHFWAQHSGRNPSQGKGSSSSSSGSGRAAARKNIAVVGVVTEVRLPCSPLWLWCGDRETHSSLTGCVMLKVRDSLGCAMSVWVDGVTEQFYCDLLARCRRCRCLCAQCCQPSPSSESLWIVLSAGCVCGAGQSSGTAEPLVAVLHKPFGLVEQQTAQADRYFAQCTAADVALVGGDGDPSGVPIGQSNSLAEAPKRGEALGIRELLCLDLGGTQQKHIAAVRAVVTHILVLEVDFKKDGDRPLDAQDSQKRRKLETLPSSYEPFDKHQQRQTWKAGTVSASVTETKKCSVTLRDTRYPDSINVYLPLSRLTEITVGCVVLLRETYLCVPELLKKLYLKPADPNRIIIDVVGRARGWQLQRLSELSAALPDPRFVDTAALQCGVGLGGGVGEGYGTCSEVAVVLRERNFLHHPPHITLRQLSQQARHSRAMWAIQCQVVYVRKLSVTLRCVKCKTSAKTAPGGLRFQCSKCSSHFTLQPLWEAQLALDDGTAECTANVEGDGVLFLLRARFDDKGLVLQEVRAVVEQHVAIHGSIVYDAFERQEFSDAKTRPYAAPTVEGAEAVSVSVGEASGRTGAGAETTEGAVFEGPSQNAVFDLPLSEKLKLLTPRFPLKGRPASIKASVVLRAYLQVGCYAHHFAAICRVDFSAAALKIAAPTAGNNGKVGKREIKLQKNNQEKPYLAYFAWRPSSADAKLSVQILHASEMHRDVLTGAGWELLTKLQQQQRSDL